MKIYDFSTSVMTDNIETYLQRKENKIAKMQRKPIIMRWLTSPRMQEALEIINMHTGYLLSEGARSKLEQWFLSDDRDFNATTAERYVIWYLRQKNPNIFDNTRREGIDAWLNLDSGSVGIEVITLNAFLAEWIFIERLTEYLGNDATLSNVGYEITSVPKRLMQEMQNEDIYHYIEQVGQAIKEGNVSALQSLDIQLSMDYPFPGSISWTYDQRQALPWFDYLTKGLARKLEASAKQKQLQTYDRNLVFVGVNHMTGLDGVYPYIFEALSGHNIHYHSEANAVIDYWTNKLQQFPTIIGICFFLYTLPSEKPFYPLRVIWRNALDSLPLSL